MTEQATRGPHWRNVRVSSLAIGLLWEFPTSFYFYASLSQDAHTKPASINYIPPPHISAKPQQKQSATRIRRRCGCLMTDSAGLSIITLIIIIISIAAGSHEHLHSSNIPGGALSLPLAQSCGVRVCRWWLRCRQHLLGGFCAGDITVQVVIPAVQMRRDGRGAAPPPLPLRSPARADLGSESRIETGSL